jgi:hypothetical protein
MKNKRDNTLVFDPTNPVVHKTTRKNKALFVIEYISKNRDRYPLFGINHRSLERNKYAPWGRGKNY